MLLITLKPILFCMTLVPIRLENHCCCVKVFYICWFYRDSNRFLVHLARILVQSSIFRTPRLKVFTAAWWFQTYPAYWPGRACHQTVADSGGSRPGVWGEVKFGGAKNVFTCLNTKGCLRQSLCVTQKRLSFVGQKMAVFVGRTMLFFREQPQFESGLSLLQKTFETGPKQWASFFTSYADLVYLQNVFNGWPKKMCTHENFNCDFD